MRHKRFRGMVAKPFAANGDREMQVHPMLIIVLALMFALAVTIIVAIFYVASVRVRPMPVDQYQDMKSFEVSWTSNEDQNAIRRAIVWPATDSNGTITAKVISLEQKEKGRWKSITTMQAWGEAEREIKAFMKRRGYPLKAIK